MIKEMADAIAGRVTSRFFFVGSGGERRADRRERNSAWCVRCLAFMFVEPNRYRPGRPSLDWLESRSPGDIVPHRGDFPRDFAAGALFICGKSCALLRFFGMIGHVNFLRLRRVTVQEARRRRV